MTLEFNIEIAKETRDLLKEHKGKQTYDEYLSLLLDKANMYLVDSNKMGHSFEIKKLKEMQEYYETRAEEYKQVIKSLEGD